MSLDWLLTYTIVFSVYCGPHVVDVSGATGVLTQTARRH